MLSPIDEIKERLDIVQVISEYLPLKKVGANYRALCPFHSEKNPSFYVSPSRQIFKCFGCGKSGDIFKFIMEIEGVEFKDALQILAKKAGVEIKKEPIEKRTERQRLYEIYELATKFFEKQLEKTKRGKQAKEYLLSRRISEDSIKKWRLGYAPNTWRGLSDFLVSKGYKRDEIIKAGLAVKKESSFEQSKNSWDSYDRFRGRIMFPIFDLQDNVIGFGGRIFHPDSDQDSSEPKYLNTPNTLIYDKSRVLYGLNKAKMEIREKDEAVLVEGYTDVILSSQAGVRNVIATSGTALTLEQLKILSRYTKNLVFSFDMDVAGQSATKRGIDIAQLQGFNIKIISLPEGKDPADVAGDNPKQWQKRVEESKEIINFYFEQSFKAFDSKTVEGKKKISEILLPFISRIQNKIEQAHWVAELAKRFKIREDTIWDQLVKIKNTQEQIGEKEESSSDMPERKKSRRRQIEERLLMLLLKFPQYFKKIKKAPTFSFPEGEMLFKTLQEGKKVPSELNQFISELELQFEIEKEEGEINPEEIDFCLSQLQKISTQEEIKKIEEELKEAEATGNKEKISHLLKKLNRLLRFINQ